MSYEFISPPDYGPKLALRFDNGSRSLVILPLSTLDSQTALTTAIPDNIPAHSTQTVESARAIRIQGRVAESFFFFNGYAPAYLRKRYESLRLYYQPQLQSNYQGKNSFGKKFKFAEVREMSIIITSECPSCKEAPNESMSYGSILGVLWEYIFKAIWNHFSLSHP